MNIHTDTFSERGKPPLTRSEVEERLRQVQLQNGKGLELVLPAPRSSEEQKSKDTNL
jgi:hypothetical protein